MWVSSNTCEERRWIFQVTGIKTYTDLMSGWWFGARGRTTHNFQTWGVYTIYTASEKKKHLSCPKNQWTLLKGGVCLTLFFAGFDLDLQFPPGTWDCMILRVSTEHCLFCGWVRMEWFLGISRLGIQHLNSPVTQCPAEPPSHLWDPFRKPFTWLGDLSREGIHHKLNLFCWIDLLESCVFMIIYIPSL